METNGEDRKDDYKIVTNATVIEEEHIEETAEDGSVIWHTDAEDGQEDDKSAENSRDSIYYNAQLKNNFNNTSKIEDSNVHISGNEDYSAQCISKSPKRSSEISPSHSSSANSRSSKEDIYEDDEMSYETEEGQNGSPAHSNHNENDCNALHLLSSNDSIHTISTSAAIEAVQVFDSDESLGNILQTTMKTSENIDGLCAKACETESSEINTSTLSNSLTTNSKDMKTSLPEKEIDIGEASAKSSMNIGEDTTKLTEVEPIPPKGSVMFDFKQNPLTISIDVGPQDSVTAKLKCISTLANEYANIPNLAQDLLKADSVSVYYKKHGNSVGIQQICAEISNVSEVHTKSAQGGGCTDFYYSSTAVINTTLKCPTDFSKDEPSMSDEDLLDHDHTGAPLEDLDLDEGKQAPAKYKPHRRNAERCSSGLF